MKRTKYNAVKTVVDGIVFHSKKEANRYVSLKILRKAGHISDLKLQFPYVFSIAGKKIFTYYADFVYTNQTGLTVVEDVKGMRTPLYKLKKKIIETYHSISIIEV